MDAQLCLLALRNGWLEAHELDAIRSGFEAVRFAIENNSSDSLKGKPAFVSLLYVACLNNQETFNQVLLSHIFLKPFLVLSRLFKTIYLIFS